MLGNSTPADFEQFILDETGCRIRFAEEVTTLPGQGGAGGRKDLFFWISNEDIMKFSVRRFALDIRWWEDVLLNGNGYIYEASVLERYPNTWAE